MWASQHRPQQDEAGPYILATDTLTALQDLAAAYRERFDVTLIGITGTNGKTTTKDMVAAALSGAYPTVKTEGNFNNHIGVPLTMFLLAAEHRMAVVEMGMSGPGEIRQIARISRPQHGLITNIGPAHLLQMGSLEAIARAKFELLEMLPEDGMAFLNGDDARVRAQTIIPGSRVITFGMEPAADYRATAIVNAGESGTEFEVTGRGIFSIPTWGRHNVYNALGAIAVSAELGVSSDRVREALKDFQPSPMRMERQEIGPVTILNDAYNANPASMRAALEVLTQTAARHHRIAVLGDMRELGANEIEAHREIGDLVASTGIDILITVGRLAEKIAHRAVQKGYPASQTILCSQAAQAARELTNILRPGDVVLLKASRAIGLEEILSILNAVAREE